MLSKFLLSFSLLLCCFSHFSIFAHADQISDPNENQPSHFTLIINQIRGSECCDIGDQNYFVHQLQTATALNLPTNFALRYDALLDPHYQTLFATASAKVANFGAFLEITPALAQAAHVTYTGNDKNWYQANHAYLIGYQPTNRLKLIDAYMSAFYQVFHYYPDFTTAWMIDPTSLSYLKDQYHVQIHQLTREQFGTDSYTLYGGPPHYPYFPSVNWALLPDSTQADRLPLIVRQTITDPVFNYGDQSNSYTSQPNDYALRDANLDYFQFLFNQAHQQSAQNYTFALVGLENSMPGAVQDEFARQLSFISSWQNSTTHQVLTTHQFYQQFLHQSLATALPTLYAGQAQNNSQEQAWWVTGDTYRARLRLSFNELFLSDLRPYSSADQDPYLETPAAVTGHWLVPFLLSNSVSYGGAVNDPLVYNDDLALQPQLPRLTLATNVDQVQTQRTPNNQLLFLADQIPVATFSATVASFGQHNLTTLGTPQVFDNTFAAAYSALFVSNRYAIAGRNPIRLIFYPRNSQNQNVYLDQNIQVTTDYPLDSKIISPPNPRNGMIFIDLNNAQPAKVNLTLSFSDYTETTAVYFAPTCKQDLVYCLKHPVQAWWYLRNWFGDQLRAWHNKH